MDQRVGLHFDTEGINIAPEWRADKWFETFKDKLGVQWGSQAELGSVNTNVLHVMTSGTGLASVWVLQYFLPPGR